MDEIERMAELAAVLDAYMYLDAPVFTDREITLGEALGIISDNDMYAEARDERAYKVITSALSEHPEWRDVVLADQSGVHASEAYYGAWSNDTPDIRDDMISAAMFRDNDGNCYVCYRGTGAGKWPDNGDGMTAASTEMQRAAAEYYDHLAEKYLKDVHAEGGKIIVTGHSKGGNEAVYTYLASENEHLIDHCLSFDGQGFSDDAVGMFKEKLGERYASKLQNAYGIYGENDFVHPLGAGVIPEENRYYVKTLEESFADLHDLNSLIGAPLDDGDEAFGYKGIGWTKEKGEIVNGVPGPVALYAFSMTEALWTLDEDDRHGSCVALMTLIDHLLADRDREWQLVGSTEATSGDYLDLVHDMLPLLKKSLLGDEAGRAMLREMLKDKAEDIMREKGAAGLAGYICLGSLAVTALMPLLAAGGIILDGAWRVTAVIDEIYDLKDKLPERFERFRETIDDIRRNITGFFDNKIRKVRRIMYGDICLNGDRLIEVDTDKLKSFASRLERIRERELEVSRKLRQMTVSGVGDMLGPLFLREGILIPDGERLARCRRFLLDAASKTEGLEREVAGYELFGL